MNFRGYEIEDQEWLPQAVRAGMTDYLRFLFSVFNLYHPVVPLLLEALKKQESRRIIDLCSGGGGATERIAEELQKSGLSVQFLLTDLYPNIPSYQYLSQKHSNIILFSNEPVDATQVPEKLKGFRTLFSGIHHFEPETVKAVLRDAVKARSGIAIFDGGNKSIWVIVLILIFHPLAILAFTPFLRPFRWSRIVFTYLLPLIPVFTVWDGIMSILSLYSPSQLKKLAFEADNALYTWQAGRVSTRFGLSVSYLIGTPV